MNKPRNSGNSAAELLFSLNTLNLCCHLLRQWWTATHPTDPVPRFSTIFLPFFFVFFFLRSHGVTMAAGMWQMSCNPHPSHVNTPALFRCRLLFCLINFYIRYTSLKMPWLCGRAIVVCYFWQSKGIRWLSSTNVARLRSGPGDTFTFTDSFVQPNGSYKIYDRSA